MLRVNCITRNCTKMSRWTRDVSLEMAEVEYTEGCKDEIGRGFKCLHERMEDFTHTFSLSPAYCLCLLLSQRANKLAGVCAACYVLLMHCRNEGKW